MARMPPSGSALGSLYERSPELDELIKGGKVDPECVTARECVTTLEAVISGLDLNLSPGDTRKVRQDLEAVIGRAFQEKARLQIIDVQQTLRLVKRGMKRIAAGQRVTSQAIEQIEETLRGRKTGFHKALGITAANEIVRALVGMVGALDEDEAWHKAEAMMFRGTEHPREIAEACRIALERLERKDGRPAIKWYPDFVSVLKFMAAKNNIRPTVWVNPRTLKVGGRFLALATRFEQLLPLAMHHQPMKQEPSG